jgi:BirA family biotin operon repressor/biotin-[acetyl-CoA-carboxylase] ligase
MTSTSDNWQKAMPLNWIVQRVAETGSTNADLFTQAQAGATHHSALMADNQTAGRGRLDRTWEAKAGANLLLSLLFRKSSGDDQPEIAQCQRVVAVSAVRACRSFVTAQKFAESIKLKWPNDLLIDSKKFGGMLSVADAEQAFIVVGIGINIGWAPDQAAKLKDLAVSSSFEPVDLLRVLLEQINTVEQLSSRALHDEYVDELATLNKLVRVELTNGEMIEGKATALDLQGRLVVQVGADMRVIDTGDVVHLRDAIEE